MKNGFTLIEMMVAVSIFAIVAMITTGALITISDVNRKAQAIKIAMDNVSFAMDSIILNLRDGAVFHCRDNLGDGLAGKSQINPALESGQSCPSGDSSLVFKNNRYSSEAQSLYRLGNGAIQYGQNGSQPLDFTSLTSSEVNISNLTFYVRNAEGGSSSPPPSVTLVIKGEVVGKTLTNFVLQTTVSARSHFSNS